MKKINNLNYIGGLIAITLVMLAGAFYAVQIPRNQEKEGLWVGHTREVISSLETLGKHITEAETGERGYVLTGDASFLAPYSAAIILINSEIDHIAELVEDNAEQQARVPALRADVASKLDHLKEVVDLRGHDGFDAASKSIASGKGRDLMKAVDQRIDEMRKEEEKLLSVRIEKWSQAAAFTRMMVLSFGGLVYLLTCIIYFNLVHEAKRRQQLAETEAQANVLQRAESKRLAQIVDIQREIAESNLDLDTAMRIITEQTQILTGATGSIVEMLEGDEVVYRAASGIASPHLGVRLKIKNSLSGLCIQQGKVLKCDDSETDERVDRAACRRVGLRSMVVVPLRHQGNPVGVLKVLSSEPNAFGEEAVTTLELTAGVLSASISDAITTDAILATNRDLTEANAKLEALATTDGLTGLKNHRHFQEQLSLETQRATRFKKPLSLVMFDVDHFKKYNDTFGHPAGDAVLKQIGSILKTTAREIDCAARYGGEEFALLLPETDAAGAAVIAERIRAAIASAVWDKRDVTVSVGTSSLSAQCKDASELLNAADKALYVSKTSGRNRVTGAGGEQAVMPLRLA